MTSITHPAFSLSLQMTCLGPRGFTRIEVAFPWQRVCRVRGLYVAYSDPFWPGGNAGVSVAPLYAWRLWHWAGIWASKLFLRRTCPDLISLFARKLPSRCALVSSTFCRFLSFAGRLAYLAAICVNQRRTKDTGSWVVLAFKWSEGLSRRYLSFLVSPFWLEIRPWIADKSPSQSPFAIFGLHNIS